MDTPIFSVSEFNEMINMHLAHLGQIVIEGEISEMRTSQGKWLFLTLKDQSAAVSVFGVLFQLSGWRALEEGMKVHVIGTPRIHQKSGRFSVTAERIVPAGEGALKVAFEKLKAQLEKEGLFDEDRKRPLPQFPQRIGLITAKGSQAYNDFEKIMRERMGGLHIYFLPVSVQGESAPDSIVKAVQYFNSAYADLDALVVCRGGGSLEDLHAFNDEHVVRALFASQIPVIVGVGHEGDISLADLVADVRASTPSNAAELLVRERTSVIQELQHLVHKIERVYTYELQSKRYDLNRYVSQFQNILHGHIRTVRSGVQNFYHAERAYARNVRGRQQQVETFVRLLHTLDYDAVLKRGFSISRGADGSIIRSADDVQKGDTLTTTVARGTIYSDITKTQS